MTRTLSSSFILALALAAGCTDIPANAEGELDGANDDAGDDKADTGGIRPNTPESFRVVQFANFAPAAEVRKAGLGKEATANILEVRRGDDGKDATLDDGYFKTLEDLDAVPYVGPKAFKAMLKYTQNDVSYNRPALDGAWTLWFDTLSGLEPVKVTSTFRITDLGDVTREVRLGQTVLPVSRSVTFYDGIYLELDDLDVAGQRIDNVHIGASIRDGETLCGHATVYFASGQVLDRRMVARRGADVSVAGNPIATLCQ
jgi:hypothetical protein